jgi:DNA-binding MarR family transcriptional regulator
VERRPDPADGRVVRLFPSPRAASLKDELIAVREASDREILSRFSSQEQAQLKGYLTALMKE